MEPGCVPENDPQKDVETEDPQVPHSELSSVQADLPTIPRNVETRIIAAEIQQKIIARFPNWRPSEHAKGFVEKLRQLTLTLQPEVTQAEESTEAPPTGTIENYTWEYQKALLTLGAFMDRKPLFPLGATPLEGLSTDDFHDFAAGQSQGHEYITQEILSSHAIQRGDLTYNDDGISALWAALSGLAFCKGNATLMDPVLKQYELRAGFTKDTFLSQTMIQTSSPKSPSSPKVISLRSAQQQVADAFYQLAFNTTGYLAQDDGCRAAILDSDKNHFFFKTLLEDFLEQTKLPNTGS